MARAVILALLASFAPVLAQNNRIDVVTPAAPELAAYGAHAIGVRTLQLVDRDRPDILNTRPGGPLARADRALTVEIWYPARLAAGQPQAGVYQTILRDPAMTATLHGRAVRDAAPLDSGGPFPLVIISHGYPGNRYLMSHLGENLASKGYVTVSIDHPHSTYDDQQAFASTLYNRALDQLFVLREIAALTPAGAPHALAGIVDASRTALVGYSMGGYGVINAVGGGFSAASVTFSSAPPNGLLADRTAASPQYRASLDPRVKAAIAIAPWGMQNGYWDAEDLRAITTPLLFVSGSVDEVSGYEKGTLALFEQTVNSPRYLLTFVNANHNAAAPIPAPAEAYEYSPRLKSYPFTHYADAVWDTTRMNNILQHFATAFLDMHLKGQTDRAGYLDLDPAGKDWRGFKPRTTAGLWMESRRGGR